MCATIFLLPKASLSTIIHNFTWTLDELVQCTMYNFPCFQSLTSNYSSEGFVQITPQLVRFWIISTGLSVKRSRRLDIEKTVFLFRIKMRVGQTEKIQFKVAHVSLHVYCNMIWGVQYFNSQALNYPVDLYYLMDLSNSMSDDRENVVKVSRNWEKVKVRSE